MSTDAEDIAAIEAALELPAATSSDGQSTQFRSASDLIALQNYKRGLNATAPGNAAALFRGMNSKIVPPGGA